MVKKITLIAFACWGQSILSSEAQSMSPLLMKDKVKTLHAFTENLKIADKNMRTACLENLTDEISQSLNQWFPKFKTSVSSIHQDFIMLKKQNDYTKLSPAEIKQLCADLSYYYQFIMVWTNSKFYNDMQSVFKRSHPAQASGLATLNQLKSYLVTENKKQHILENILDIAEQISATVTERSITDLHIPIKIFTPHGQVPTTTTPSTPTKPAPTPAPKPKPVPSNNPKFWNVSSKTITITTKSGGVTAIVAPGKVWKPLTIDQDGFLIECEGLKPIMIILKGIKTADIIALDAGRLLFGSKVPESAKIKFQYFTKQDAKTYALKNKLNANNL